MSTFLGELLGTMFLVLLGNGVVAGVVLNESKAKNSGWIVITAGWAFAVMSAIFVAKATGSPGAAIDPAVTVAAMLRGAVAPADALMQIAGQFIGAFIGATLVWFHYFPHWVKTDDAGVKLACFSTSPAIRHTPSNLLGEIIGTFTLVFVIFSIFSQGATGNGPAEGLGSFLVAGLIWGIGLSLGGTTGFALNPARDLGPRIAYAILPIPGKSDPDWIYSWIPVVGPFIGAAIAAGLAQVFIK